MTYPRPTVPPLVLSVDPGANTAWVRWENGTLHSYGLVHREDLEAITRLIEGLTRGLPRDTTGTLVDQPVLVVEDQYLGILAGNGSKSPKRRKPNPQTYARLIECRMRWTVLAELNGWRVVNVLPRVWQSPMHKGAPGKDTKARSMHVATGIMGQEPPVHDIADAVCIGKHHLGQYDPPAQG